MGDFSQEYTNDNKGMIFFALGNNKTSFKPFIDSFSFSFASAVDKAAGSIFNKTIAIEEFKEAKYSVSFNIVAANVNESIENHKKFQKLLRMMIPQDAEDLAVAKILYVKFSNLISNKGQTGKNNMSAASIKEQGFEGVIKALKYEPDMDIGFFEYNGMLFSKSFKINFDLTAIPKANKAIVPSFRSGYAYGRTYPDFEGKAIQSSVGPPQPSNNNGGSGGDGGGGAGGPNGNAGQTNTQESSNEVNDALNVKTPE